MRVQPLTLGPIVGETTTDRARILLRGDPQALAKERKPVLGRVQWRPRGGQRWQGPLPVRFNRNFDFTGLAVLNGLSPGTDYELRAGWVGQAPANNEQLDWRYASVGGFRTAPASPDAPVECFFGSCCYRFFAPGGDIDDDRADKAFRGMSRVVDEEGPVDFTLFVGDQVYADPLAGVGDLSHLDRFLQLYRSAFTQPHLAYRLANTSTYMILDDHEIENNWPAHADNADWVVKLPAAMKAYQIYQAVYGPATPLTDDGRYPARDPHVLWYTFSRGCADFFVLDCRTERVLAEGAQRHMISPHQEQALMDWLATDTDRIKCVVSSVVVFPDAKPLFRHGDAWDGFMHQRARILEHIRQLGLERVVFLSGDVHASLASRLRCRSPAGKELSMYSLVSSALHWPSALFPFRWRGWMVDMQDKLETPGSRARYRVEPLTGVYDGDVFARLRLSPEGVQFRLYDRKGEPLPDYSHDIRF